MFHDEQIIQADTMRAPARRTRPGNVSRAARTSLLMLVALAFTPFAASAQRDMCAHKFVTFPAGSATYKAAGTLKRGACRVYRLDAREGQRMTISLKSRAASVRISLDSGKCCTPEGALAFDVKEWSEELPVTDHYDVFVTPSRGGKKSSVPYTLEITVK